MTIQGVGVEYERIFTLYISYTRESVSLAGYRNTEKRVENTTRSEVFLFRTFKVFG